MKKDFKKIADVFKEEVLNLLDKKSVEKEVVIFILEGKDATNYRLIKGLADEGQEEHAMKFLFSKALAEKMMELVRLLTVKGLL